MMEILVAWDYYDMHIFVRGHPLKTYAKFSEKLTARIRGLEMLVFRKILRTYLMMAPNEITRLSA